MDELERFDMWIGGERRSGPVRDTVLAPWDDQPVGTVARGSAADVDDAIAAAAGAFPSFRRTPSHERARLLETVAAALQERAEPFARRLSREAGKPITQARGEVARAVLTLKLGAAEARRLGGEVLPLDLEARAEGRTCIVQRVPRGPVAAIAPFNFPLNLVVHKVAPAVAVGCTTVLKPPPQAPLSAHALVDLFHDAGIAPGALNVVHCAPEDAQRMVVDPRTKVLSFTGSDGVGWKLEGLARKKQVLLELGGNAPCVVDEGTDLERALASVVPGAWAYAGQVCIKAQRVFVHASLYGPFLEGFVAATRALACGDPAEEGTVVGPMIEDVHVERVLGWIREAEAAGATVHTGGRAEGRVVLPTILTGVPETARVCRDEVFGPVTVVEPFDDFEAVLARCNDTRYGLQAGVFTPRIDRALRAFQVLDYGGVVINDVPTFRVDNFPYGGTKDSGVGREGLASAVQELTEPKVLILRG